MFLVVSPTSRRERGLLVMNPIAKIVNDRAVVLTARVLLICLMVLAAIRFVVWMFGAQLNIQINLDI